MTQNERTLRVVARGVGLLAALNLIVAALLCVNEIEVGGVYHPEGWALVWQQDLPILLFLLAVPAALALLWSRAAARIMEVRWPAALKRVVTFAGQGMLAGLLIVVLLLAVRSVLVWRRV